MSDLSHLEAQVSMHRTDMAKSLSALTETLTPRAVSDDLTSLAEGYLGEAGKQVTELAKSKPLALAVMGLGIALLASGSRKETTKEARTGPALVPADEALIGVDERIRAADQKMSDAYEPAASLMERDLSRGLDRLPAAAKERVTAARRTAIKAQRQVEEHRKKATKSIFRTISDRPILAGAVAFGFGAIAAALTPRTDVEDATLGQHRDAMVKDAKETLRRELAALKSQTTESITAAGQSERQHL